MTRTEIAARVGAAQYDLANGRRQLDVEKDLIRLRKEIVAAGLGEPYGQSILDGYRQNALEQLNRLRELLHDRELHTMPDIEMFHLSACCELARQQVMHYFNLRNSAAASSVQEVASCQG